jgi:RNA 2',3'-cyclic 3'-phosphodiesterase
MKYMSDQQSKRLFIAVKIVPEKRLASLISEFHAALAKERISWTNPANLHITLAFLGNTETGKIASIKEMLGEKFSGAGSFSLTMKGTGLFGKKNDPRVIWVGLDKYTALEEIYLSVTEGLHDLDVDIKERSFSPHLTIGRIKSITGMDTLAALISRHRDQYLQTIQVDRIILYESLLLPSGPLYTPLAEIFF